MIQSLDEAVKLTQGEVGQELVENTILMPTYALSVGLFWFPCSYELEKPIKTVADLKGVTVRVPKNEIMIDTYKSWASTQPQWLGQKRLQPFNNVLLMVKTTRYITVSAMKFNEVQKYVTNLRYLFSIEPLIVSESMFQDLSDEKKAAILAAGKAATAHSEAFLRAQEATIKKDLMAKGMEISDPADGEKEFIEKATSAVWPKFYDSIGGKDKLDRVLKIVGR